MHGFYFVYAYNEIYHDFQVDMSLAYTTFYITCIA